MIIQHNIAAMEGARNLRIANAAKSKTSERLSSGYRINRSADDAAGLFISEKMRRQIRGLNRASVNAQDGISLIQVAEGALNEIHDMLHRMSELSVQAANDTNADVDRKALQKEVDELLDEIDRISDSTEFNKIPVLRSETPVKIAGGSRPVVSMDSYISVTTPGGSTISKYGTYIDFSGIDENNIDEMVGKEFYATCTDNCSQIFNFKFTSGSGSSTTLNGDSLYVEVGLANLTSGQEMVDEIMNQVRAQQSTGPFAGYTGDYLFIGHANGLSSNGASLQLFSTYSGPPYNAGMGKVHAGGLIDDERTLLLQVGAESNVTSEVLIKTINTETLGISDINITTQATANQSIETLQEAVNIVSDQRAYFGAKQNELNHTISNLLNTSENVQSAESRIRDADMASEMLDYSKHNIIEQVAMSMITQANQNKEGVLRLFS